MLVVAVKTIAASQKELSIMSKHNVATFFAGLGVVLFVIAAFVIGTTTVFLNQGGLFWMDLGLISVAFAFFVDHLPFDNA
jgi:hypothetical protein